MIGLDLVIEDLKTRIATIDYMETVYGRATVMQDLWGDKSIISVPKVAITDTEYKMPLPNDTTEPQAFFQAVGKEEFGEFDRLSIGNISRQIAVTFWGKLGEGDTPNSTEQIKQDFLSVLQKSPYVSEINSYIDEKYDEVFPDFKGYFTNITKENKAGEQRTQWLMQPWGGLRLVFTVNYTQTPTGCQ